MDTPKHDYQSLLILILVQVTLNYVGSQSYDNKDLHKNNMHSMPFQFSDALISKNLFKSRAIAVTRDISNVNDTVTKSPRYKKWQVGRVSRKQYEIINMLWTRTQEFGETSHPLSNLPSSTKSTLSTSSFIEFYYLDEIDEPVKDNSQKRQLISGEKIRSQSGYLRRKPADHPIFAFHINDPNYIRLPLHSNDFMIPKTEIPSSASFNYKTLPKLNLQQSKLMNKIRTNLLNNSKCNYLNTTNEIGRDEVFFTMNYGTTDNYPMAMKTTFISNGFNLTTLYDKIKFFEAYDYNTPLPFHIEVKNPINLSNIDNNDNNNLKIIMDNSDEIFRNGNSKSLKPKHTKKHITENFRRERKDIPSEKNILNSVRFFNATKKNLTNLQLKKALPSMFNVTKLVYNNMSKVTTWPEYSFMAAYIHEPSQVQCDAAGISPHWLVTSGLCLSKHHKDPREGRSAYISYCSSSWWNAERVTYVKYSVVHPRYNGRDKNRRHMYNIGLIQVVISMATCHGWAPVTLISHQFAANLESFKAYAVGWGLDRYDTRHAAELPRYPLMAHESNVFLKLCPGKLSHGQAKGTNIHDDMQNVYCLLLPPYSGETTDPIHGSMLLAEGKLCAIYLQEERRPSGNQSAQYTGIWRLGPWVSKVAYEPDDADNFDFVK